MKTQITLEIDVDQIAQDLMEREGSAGYSSIRYAVQEEIKRQAVEQVKRDILSEANVTSLVEHGYSGRDYLTQLTKETLQEQLKTHTEAFVKDWIKNNMKWVVEKCLRDTLDSLVVPRLQKMITNMLIVDTETMEEQMRDMEQVLQDQAAGAYEAGQVAGYEEARNRI